jgi:hypothetical protein
MTTYYLYEMHETKPTDAIWWPTAFPAEAQSRSVVIDSFATYFNATSEDTNNKDIKIYFNTEEEFLRFSTTMEGLPSTPGRNDYNNQNGIVTTVLYNGYTEAVLPI